jgi:uncharacterized protein (DUF2141 family)
MKSSSLLTALIFSALGVLPAAALDLTITVKGIRNNKGKIAALAFVNKDGFPDQVPKAQTQAVVDAKQGTVTLTLKNVPAGKVAVTVLHDENANGKLNRNFFGIPLEGVGMSGKPPGNKPPTFNDVVLEVKKSQKLEITLKYW